MQGLRGFEEANGRRTLWRVLALGFAASLLGAMVLFVPTLEFFAFDLAERLHLNLRWLAPAAMYTVFGMLLGCGAGLMALGVEWLFRRFRRRRS
jgi:hypothetical protein